MTHEYLAGTAKKEMTSFIPGVGMMGYGQPHNKVVEVGTPLWARCLVLKDSNGKCIILIHLEQAFVTMALKEEIFHRIKLNHPHLALEESDLLVTAQHTHSAPGGYSHYHFYNLTILGFQTKVFETIVAGAVLAVSDALKELTPVSLKWGEVQISPDKEVAFNRSIHAYLNNPEAAKLSLNDKSLAVNRTMEGILIHDQAGKLKAHLNWFGVHCTSISSFNQRIHHDNKGVAADLFEKNHPGTVAFFLQHTAGDISPNFIWDKKIGLMRGKFSDQYENAAFNGEIQFRESERIKPTHTATGRIESYLSYVDMAQAAAPPAHGLAFFRGTLEGPGISAGFAAVLRITSRIRRFIDCMRSPECVEFYKKHAPKDVVVDHRNGSFVGVPIKFWKTLPVIPVHPLSVLQRSAKARALETLPWVPSIIPFQLLRIGNFLIAGIPGEITTVAGKRVHQLIEEESRGCGIEKIIITSYANAYMGYVTTAEEYEMQAYEGGHNVYGSGTLDAVLLTYKKLVSRMRGDFCESDTVTPFHFPAEELSRRSV